ncbi:hypothetical protein MRX96_048200 [Rhipicephalus microplus]
MADGEPPLHRVRHHVHGVNWRPTRFVDGVPYYHSCGLCNVIPRKTVLLPCSHVLCQSCYRGSITEDDGGDGRGGVCPLDEDPFEVHQCARIRLSATKPTAGTKKMVVSMWALFKKSSHTAKSSAPFTPWRARGAERTSYTLTFRRTTWLAVVEAPSPDDEGFSMEDLTAFLAELEGLDTYSPE